MGLYNAELFNNLGLCCFFAQQFDMVITCFERALSLAINENAADVWYNIAHIAIVSIHFEVFTYLITYLVYKTHESFFLVLFK